MLDLYSSYCQVQPHARKGSSFHCNKATGTKPLDLRSIYYKQQNKRPQVFPHEHYEENEAEKKSNGHDRLSEQAGKNNFFGKASTISNGSNFVVNQSRNKQRYTVMVTTTGEDTKLKFSIEPKPGEEAFQQWKDAMKAVARLPVGIPDAFRKKVWLSLAEHYIEQQKFDWDRIRAFSFNERSNPDDNTLGLQIVKDLHRTGCDRFCTETDQTILKRVLLAYARWNKRVGYCQGFNVLAALILEVTERNEEDALKIMIFLVDHVLPESYYAQNLQALSVDMAVFRDLLKIRSSDLAEHLELLQRQASNLLISSRTPSSSNKSYNSAASGYEPPLTNVFTMQWFLTLFATCLPADIVLKVWDAVLLEGSEVLLRVALVCWDKLADRIRRVESADQFYSLMGRLTQDLAEGKIFSGHEPISTMYNMTSFPYPGLAELREKYTYNITPFSSALPSSYLASSSATSPKSNKHSSTKSRNNKSINDDENVDDLDDSSLGNLGCFASFGLFGNKSLSQASLSTTSSMSSIDISDVSPGTVAANSSTTFSPGATLPGTYRERMSTNLSALAAQYQKIQYRQKKASLLFSSNNKSTRSTHSNEENRGLIGLLDPPGVMNHLFLGHKVQEQRNRRVSQQNNRVCYDDLQSSSSYEKSSSLSKDPNTGNCRVSINSRKPEHTESAYVTRSPSTSDATHLETFETSIDKSSRPVSNLQNASLNPSITAKIVAKMTERTSEMLNNTSNEKQKPYPPPLSFNKLQDNTELSIKGSSLCSPLSTPTFDNQSEDSSIGSMNETQEELIAPEETDNSDTMTQLTSGLKHLPFPKRPMLHRINFGSQFGLYHAMTTSPMLRSSLNACLVQSLHSTCQN